MNNNINIIAGSLVRLTRKSSLSGLPKYVRDEKGKFDLVTVGDSTQQAENLLPRQLLIFVEQRFEANGAVIGYYCLNPITGSIVCMFDAEIEPLSTKG